MVEKKADGMTILLAVFVIAVITTATTSFI